MSLIKRFKCFKCFAGSVEGIESKVFPTIGAVLYPNERFEVSLAT